MLVEEFPINTKDHGTDKIAFEENRRNLKKCETMAHSIMSFLKTEICKGWWVEIMNKCNDYAFRHQKYAF